MSTNPRPSAPTATATVLQVALAALSDLPPSKPGEPCPRCGSYGFNIHQRTWKSIKDPQVRRILTIRYRCKRCGSVLRQYGDGVGPDRQSSAIKKLSVLLYCLGLSYQATRDVLEDLGCALSPATIRKNVMDSHPYLARRKPRLARVGPRELAGQDGRIAVQIAGTPTTNRWVEVTIPRGPGADDMIWQVSHCAEMLSEKK